MKTKNNPIAIVTCILAWTLFLISIAPLLYMGRYSHPLYDDFGSSFIRHILLEKHFFIVALLNPIFVAIGAWFTWQGTYSAEIMFALQPGAWLLSSYWVTPFIIIGSISFAYNFFWRTVSKHLFQSKPIYGSIIAALLLGVQFQYTPHLHSAFYWYNGSIYYGFFYALMFIEFAYVIRLIFGGKYNKKLLVALTLFVSGGNYSVALIHVLVLLILCFIILVQKKEKNDNLWHVTLVAVIGLVCNVIAPGNSVRAAECIPMSAPTAIFESIKYAVNSCIEWTNYPQLALLLMLLPFIRLMAKNSKMSFRNMIVAIVLLFGLFAAMTTPSFYAQSFAGAERQIDMYYYSYYMMVALCLTCIITWTSSLTMVKRIAPQFICIILALTTVASFGIMALEVKEKRFSNTNAKIIWTDIKSGNAAAWDLQYKEKINEIIAADKECYIEEIDAESNVLPRTGMGISEDPSYWVNDFMAKYYGKDKVYLKK